MILPKRASKPCFSFLSLSAYFPLFLTKKTQQNVTIPHFNRDHNKQLHPLTKQKTGPTIWALQCQKTELFRTSKSCQEEKIKGEDVSGGFRRGGGRFGFKSEVSCLCQEAGPGLQDYFLKKALAEQLLWKKGVPLAQAWQPPLLCKYRFS